MTRKLTAQERETRDALTARAALHAVTAHGKNPGIVVDDLIKVEKMLERIVQLADKDGVVYTLDRVGGGVRVVVGTNWIFIAAADCLTGVGGS